MTTKTSNTALTMLGSQRPPFVPEGAEAMTVRIDLPPGDPGSPPHRHSGPVFGYMLEGEMIFELEGEPERVIRAGEAFWEPGGDVIHYQAANNLADRWSRFVVVMLCAPGQEMLVYVDDEELEQRRDRRVGRVSVMRVFLAGATGVIGRRLVPLLVGRGHSVTGFVRRSADADWLYSLGAKAVVGDVFDADGVRRAVALAAPDVVMHQLTDLKGGNREANSEMRVTGTRHLVDAALAAGVRRVVAQSIAWAYEPGPVPATEDVPLDLGSSGQPAADGAGSGCPGGGGAGGAGVGGAAVRAAVRARDLVRAGRADGGCRGARRAGGGRGREQLRARGRRGGRGGRGTGVADRVRERV